MVVSMFSLGNLNSFVPASVIVPAFVCERTSPPRIVTAVLFETTAPSASFVKSQTVFIASSSSTE